MQTGTVNMTCGGVKRTMISFALPVFLSQLFQQLYNTADSLIVGNLLGKNALAAVSSSSSLLFLLTSLVTGVAMGAGVVISRYFGAREEKTVSQAVHTTVAFGLVAGVVLTLVGVLLSPVLLELMDTDPAVMDGAVSYFRCYFMGALPMVLYNAFTGIMNALGDSRRPLYYLIFSSALNVVLDIVFISVFGYGVGSAAVATSISQAASAILCYLHLRKPGTIYQLQLRKIRFHRSLLREIMRMGLPTGIQNSVIALANVLLQSHINSFGADAMAACGIYSKLQGFAFLPITSFTMAITTFISQNLGAAEYDRAKRGAKFGILSSLILAELIGILLTVFSPVLAKLFNGDEAVVAITVSQSHIENYFFFLLAFSHAISAVLRGAGRSVIPMTVMLAVWCVFRIIYISIAMRISHTIELLFWAYPITWAISSLIFLIYYLKSDWLHTYDRSKQLIDTP